MLLLEYNKFDISQGLNINSFNIRLCPVAVEANESYSGTTQTSLSVWDSSIILAQYLAYHEIPKNKRILEFGAGRGIVGMAASVLGAKSVIVTDVAEAIDGLVANIKYNNLDNSVINAQVFNWLHPFYIQTDILVMADVVWVQELIPPLVDAIVKLSPPEIIMAHQTRSSLIDSQFWELMNNYGFKGEAVSNERLNPQFKKSSVTVFHIKKG